jgi:hypothetical protein
VLAILNVLSVSVSLSFCRVASTVYFIIKSTGMRWKEVDTTMKPLGEPPVPACRM